LFWFLEQTELILFLMMMMSEKCNRDINSLGSPLLRERFSQSFGCWILLQCQVGFEIFNRNTSIQRAMLNDDLVNNSYQTLNLRSDKLKGQ
jgi:hypothetical protein